MGVKKNQHSIFEIQGQTLEFNHYFIKINHSKIAYFITDSVWKLLSRHKDSEALLACEGQSRFKVFKLRGNHCVFAPKKRLVFKEGSNGSARWSGPGNLLPLLRLTCVIYGEVNDKKEGMGFCRLRVLSGWC